MEGQYSVRGVLSAPSRAEYLLPALLLCVWALMITDRVHAETTTVDFNIPIQTVPAALNEFARQARVQLFFITDGFENVRANEVVGTFPRQEALQRLLEGTGLEANYTPDALIKVVPAADSTSSAIMPSNTLALASAEISSDRMIAQAVDQSLDVAASQGGAPVVNDEVREEIIITGSRIRAAQSAAPVVTITREEIDKSGFATTERLVTSLPQNFAGGASQENFSDNFGRTNNIGNFSGSGVSIDLRGMGADSTLVLLNGRRQVSSGFRSAFTDVASIPVTAIERVEILTDGASAIYGADAIAGVVNFILRNDYDGAETRLRYSPDFGADTSDIRFGQMFGKSWDNGNLLFTYEYFNQDNLDTADRAVAASSDLRPLGGDDWSRIGGNPGTIRVTHPDGSRHFYAIPAGQDGAPGTLSPADFVQDTTNLRNRREAMDLYGEQERHNAMAVVRQSFSEKLEFFVDARYSKREATSRTFKSDVDITVPNTNPYFVDPSGTGATSVRIENYNFVDEVGSTFLDGDVETFGANMGVSIGIGASWQGELSGSYAQEEMINRTRNTVSRSAANAAAARTTLETALNPFGDGSNTNPAVIAGLIGGGSGSDSEQSMWGAQLSFDGNLFELADGYARLATGLEYRKETLKNATASSGSLTPGADAERTMVAVYAEAFFPLISQSAERRGINRLELSIAGRYENYDDFGDSANPKLGILWSPISSLNIRGTIGTSFKPPLLSQLDRTPGLSNFETLSPFTGQNFLLRFGGNESLVPEEATTWTAGIQIAPENSGLNLDLTYFSIDIDDRIRRAVPSEFTALQPQFAAFVTLNPTQEEINALASTPNYQNFFGISAQDLIDGLVPVVAIVDQRLQNTARTKVTGLDLQVAHSFDSVAGQFDLGLNGSYLFKIEDTLLPTDVPIDRVNTVKNPVDLRLRGSLSWSRNGWGASAFVNYTDSYTNDERDPVVESIDSWTTVDLQLSYDTEQRFSNSWLNGTRLSLTIQNLFDEEPPFANLSRGIGYDPTNSSAVGQLIALQVTKEWNKK